MPIASSPEAVSRINADFTVSDDFSTHLPLLVLELQADEAASGAVTAQLALYDKPGGVNSLRDTPTASFPVRLTPVAGTLRRGKSTFAIVQIDDNPVPLADLPPAGEWVLQGTLRDKSMLRNGIAYQIGRALFPDATPETRFCEVLFHQDGSHRYQGIFILSESLRRIGSELAAGDENAVFLQRTVGQERRGDHIIRVGSKIFTAFTMKNGILAPRALSEDERRQLSVRLEKVESILYSVHPSSFLAYENYFEEESLVNFFILNNITMNAFDNPARFLLFENKRGKFQFIPEWDFSESIDNHPERNRPLPFEKKVEEIAPPSILSRKIPVWRTLESGGDIRDLRMYPVYQAFSGGNFMWYDRFFLSSSFIKNLYSRYHELRRLELSPAKIAAMVDGLAGSLGHAQERDWFRWRAEYGSENRLYALEPYVDGKEESHNRQTDAYEEELVKINYCLREQDKFIIAQLEELDWMTADLYDKGTSGTRQAAYAFAILAGMFILTHLLTRRL